MKTLKLKTVPDKEANVKLNIIAYQQKTYTSMGTVGLNNTELKMNEKGSKMKWRILQILPGPCQKLSMAFLFILRTRSMSDVDSISNFLQHFHRLIFAEL